MNNFYKQLDNAIFLALSASELGDAVSLRYAEEAIARWQLKHGLDETTSAVQKESPASDASKESKD